MTLLVHAQALFRPVLDYALPPRCPSCGVIVSDSLAFCTDCWLSIDFIGDPHCDICGLELPGSPLAYNVQCGACLAETPPFDRARAVMRYGDVGRTIAHRLKYGRRVSLARVMAAHMARLLPMDQEDMILMPVPLHRRRIWSRGFNQAAVIGQQISKRTGIRFEPDLLRRTVNTPPLHSLGRRERGKAVKSAFALAPSAKPKITGRTIILLDDIWTTGATVTACAKALKRGGAARVEILCWARVGEGGD
jgi:ComF family protein